VFADSVAEEGIDVGFCIGAAEVGHYAGGDESSDARSSRIGVAGAGLAVDREPILDEVPEFLITNSSVVLKVWDRVYVTTRISYDKPFSSSPISSVTYDERGLSMMHWS
jgi:hypothetical protein